MGAVGQRPRTSRQARSRCETARSEKLRPVETRTRRPCGVGADRPLNDHGIFLVIGGGYQEPIRADEPIHFASHSDIPGEIDSRLDGKSDAGNQLSFLPRLEIVDVRSGSMEVARIDRVAGPVDEVLTVSTFRNHVPGGVVHFSTSNRTVSAYPLTQQRNSGIPGIPHCQPDLAVARARRAK